MKKHIAESLPQRKHAPAAAGAAPTEDADGKKGKAGKSPEDKVRQAVYDIRYRARREDIPLKSAFDQYMSNSSMTQDERSAVQGKLFGKSVAENYNIKDFASNSVASALYKVFVEGIQPSGPLQLSYVEEVDTAAYKKYQVRVYDRNGKSYTRIATQDKIRQLESNPNIEKVVKITSDPNKIRRDVGFGSPYEGEAKKVNDKNLANNYPPYDKVTRGDVIAGARDEDQMGGKRKTVSSSYEPKGDVLGEAGGRHGGGSMVGKPGGPPPRNTKTAEKKSVQEVHNPEHKKGGKGDGNLANNYPPYDKVTRGDVIAGRLGKDEMGGKKKFNEDFLIDGVKKITKEYEDKIIDVMKGSNTVTINPDMPGDRSDTKPSLQLAHYDSGYDKFLVMLQEKAESEQQQKLFGLALSVKRGQTPRSEVSAEVLKIVDTMSEKKIRDFAKTKHEGLPVKVQKEEKEGEESCESPNSTQERDKRGDYAKLNVLKNKLRSAMGVKNPIVMVASYEPEGDQIDERARARRGQPRPDTTSLSHRVMMDVRNKNKEGLMTRSGKTVAQHERERGVPERDRPQPESTTPAQRLELKKKRAATAQRAQQDMYKPRAGESD